MRRLRARRGVKADFRDEDAGQLAWYQQPTKLAGIGPVAVVVLNVLFW